MQNRYVGDVGNFVKFAILRVLLHESSRRLGMLWWLHPGETHTNDGRYRQYLARREEWRRFDIALFDGLAAINSSGVHSVCALEQLMPKAQYFSEMVPCEGSPSVRPAARRAWLATARDLLRDCDLLFLDPDNGVASPKSTARQKRSGKSVMLGDLVELRREGRAFVICHHQTRRRGGHALEFEHLADLLETTGMKVCGALRAKPWSPRLFLFVDGDAELSAQAARIADEWGDHIRWIPRACAQNSNA